MAIIKTNHSYLQQAKDILRTSDWCWHQVIVAVLRQYLLLLVALELNESWPILVTINLTAKLESIWCSHWIHAKLYAHLKSSSPFPSSSRILRGLILLSYRFSHSDKHNSHPATIRSSSFVKNAQALLRGATVNALYMINIGTST